jgi:2,4'-dihydroxyacetophenone dioxygenase
MEKTTPAQAVPAPAAPKNSPDLRRIPYQLPQPVGMRSDMAMPDAINLAADEHLWVPQGEGAWFKPLILNVSEGYYINLLRVKRAGVLSRHRHSGPVHAFTLRGRWHYLEHDWVASEGSYIFEPPGETHTLVVPEDVSEMITLFHVSGGYVYVDPHGTALGYEDVFTKLEKAREHYEAAGLGADFVSRYIR